MGYDDALVKGGLGSTIWPISPQFVLFKSCQNGGARWEILDCTKNIMINRRISSNLQWAKASPIASRTPCKKQFLDGCISMMATIERTITWLGLVGYCFCIAAKNNTQLHYSYHPTNLPLADTMILMSGEQDLTANDTAGMAIICRTGGHGLETFCSNG